MKLTGPIVIIGAGRSGTTLLSFMLDAHPDIFMLGETEFIIPKLWHILWDITASGHERHKRIKLEVSQWFPTFDPINDKLLFSFAATVEENERRRISKIALTTVDELFSLSKKNATYWGFKEPWTGSDSNFKDWVCYDYVVPDALWVHIVRHPFDFARSCSDWHRRTPFNAESLYYNLDAWVKNVVTNAERKNTGHYVNFRYEDLIADPEKTLVPVFEQLSIRFHNNCLKPLKKKHLPSLLRSPIPAFDRDVILQIPHLSQLMEKYEYTIPELTVTYEKDITEAEDVLPVAVSFGDSEWILNPPFACENNFCWYVNFESIPEHSVLINIADDLQHPYRSSLQLFEDGKPLGPPHSLHARIRAEGKGAYSHWINIGLLFSTSDNSDPNSNGRKYTFSL